jgi:hypothetical protein
MVLIVHVLVVIKNNKWCMVHVLNGTDNWKTYHQQVVDMQRSVQTKCCDYHDERMREIGTICKPTEGEQCSKGEETVYDTCADKAQSILAQSFHGPCTKNVDYTSSSIV